MERNEEVGRIMKKDFDSLCPYCKSRAIFRIGECRSIAHDSCWNLDDPQARTEEWRCAVCSRVFILF